MKALMCDSTKNELLIVLSVDGNVYSKSVQGKKGHSSLIMELIDSLFKQADITPDDIDVYSVCVGPGSFTGIRIGVSVFNALAYATNAKRVEINAFELKSHGLNDGVFTIDAGNGNLYVCNKADGKCELSFVESGNVVDVVPTESDVDYPLAFKELVEEKYSKCEFVSCFKPLYLRKSQAERNLDEKA